MADSIRTLLIGRELVEGTLPAASAWAATATLSLGARRRKLATPDGTVFEVTTAGTTGGTEPAWPTTIGATVVDGTVTWTHAGYLMWNMPFTEGNLTLSRNRIIPDEHNGTRIRARVARRGPSSSTFQFTMLGYYDLLGIPLMSALNAPSVVADGGASGVFEATFKAGGANVPTLAIQFYDGAEWWQLLGASVTSWSPTITGDGLPAFQFSLVTREATRIAAPTIPAQTWASYVHPMDVPQQSVSVNASPYADLLTASLNINNNREPLFTIGSASMRRATEGVVEVGFDLEAIYTAYSGSLLEDHVENTSPGAVVLTVEDTATAIGSGTPTTPRMQISVPAPLLTSGEPDPSNVETRQTISGTAGYNSASATALSVALRNEWPAYIYEGN
jgi:hypothetical protein